MFAGLFRREVTAEGADCGPLTLKVCRLRLDRSEVELLAWRVEPATVPPESARVSLGGHLSAIHGIPWPVDDVERYFSFAASEGLVRFEQVDEGKAQLAAAPLVGVGRVLDFEALALVSACRQAYGESENWGILHLGESGRSLILPEGAAVRSYWCGYWPNQQGGQNSSEELSATLQVRWNYLRARRVPVPPKLWVTGDHAALLDIPEHAQEWGVSLQLADPFRGIRVLGPAPPEPARLAVAVGLALRQLNPPGLRYKVGSGCSIGKEIDGQKQIPGW